MQLHWNHALSAWTADVHPPGTGADPAIGPAGPMGVSQLRVGEASVSTCTVTGRVSSLWFGPEPDDEERALLAAVLAEPVGGVDLSRRDGALELTVAPVADRVDLARASNLFDTVRHVELTSDANLLARTLAWAELAATLARLHLSPPPGGERLIRRARVTEALTAADQLWGRLQATRFVAADLPPALRANGVDPSLTHPLLRAVLKDLDAFVAVVGEEEPGRAIRRLVGNLVDALDRAALEGAPMGVLAGYEARLLELPVHDPFADQPRPGLPVVARAEGDTLILGDDAARLLGIASATVERLGSWHVVACREAPEGNRPPYVWVSAHGADGTLVGAAQLGGFPDALTARVAVAGEVEHYRFHDNLLRRPNDAVPFASFEAASELSRAAWVDRQAGRPAERSFALACLAWLQLGLTFRAGWAWLLADHGLVRHGLESLGRPELEAALAAVAASGDVPAPGPVSSTAPGELPAPLWALLAARDSLLPVDADA